MAPTRLLDTRSNLGGSTLAAGGSLSLSVAGVNGIPAADQIAAVVMNVTVTDPSGPGGGFITAWGMGAAGRSSRI